MGGRRGADQRCKASPRGPEGLAGLRDVGQAAVPVGGGGTRPGYTQTTSPDR